MQQLDHGNHYGLSVFACLSGPSLCHPVFRMLHCPCEAPEPLTLNNVHCVSFLVTTVVKVHMYNCTITHQLLSVSRYTDRRSVNPQLVTMYSAELVDSLRSPTSSDHVSRPSFDSG